MLCNRYMFIDAIFVTLVIIYMDGNTCRPSAMVGNKMCASLLENNTDVMIVVIG
jgi:hypothetical protein